MGTWGSGPFDNDMAADFCGNLNEAAPDERPGMIRSCFASVIASADGYLEGDEADYAIAAATIVASQLPGGTPVTSAYAPDFLLEGGSVAVEDEVRSLAVRALDRIMAPESEWVELWSETDEFDRVLAGTRRLRDTLAAG